MNFFVKVQIGKIRKLKKCNMESISEVSTLANKMGMKTLVTFLYNNSDEYLEYIRKQK